MNISRIALLSALITVPMFSMENNDPKSNTVNTASTDTSTAEKAGIIAAITAFATARKDNSLAFLDFFANYSFNPFFRKLATFDCLKGGRFENNITPAGRVIISAAFVAAFYAAYNAYNAQDVDTDEDIFGDEYDADIN